MNATGKRLALNWSTIPPLIFWVIGLMAMIVGLPMWVSLQRMHSVISIAALWFPLVGAGAAAVACGIAVTALSIRPLWQRAVLAGAIWLLLVVMSYAVRSIMAWAYAWGPFMLPSSFGELLQEFGSYIAGFWLALLPAVLLRVALNWRIAKPTDVVPRQQWSIGQILFLTAILAMTMSVLEFIVRYTDDEFFADNVIRRQRMELLIHSLSILALSAVVVPLPTAVILRPGSAARCVWMVSGFTLMAAMVAGDVILTIPAGDAADAALAVVVLVSSFMAAATLILLPFRLRGYRLLWGWRSQSADVPQTTSKPHNG